MAKRRGNNEGTIFKRKDGRWSAEVSIGGKRRTKYGKTRNEVQEWLHETLTEIHRGLRKNIGTKISLQKYMEIWLDAMKSQIRPNTWSQYAQISRQHIFPILGSLQLNDLEPHHVQTFYSKKFEDGVGQSTRGMIHSVLHRAMNVALDWGFIRRNPVTSIKKPKQDKREMQFLTSEEAFRFLNVAKKNRYAALYYLAIATGMRQGEILGLKWGDLDFQSGRLQIQRQLQRVRGQALLFTQPKSASSRRIVLLGSKTLDRLRDHLKNQKMERLFAGEKWEENELIFPSSKGTPLDTSSLFRNFKVLLKEANLPNIRFHDLRHTAATLMFQQGVHPKIVQERLGHSSIGITMDVYSHAIPSLQMEAANCMDDLLNPIPIDRDFVRMQT